MLTNRIIRTKQQHHSLTIVRHYYVPDRWDNPTKETWSREHQKFRDPRQLVDHCPMKNFKKVSIWRWLKPRYQKANFMGFADMDFADQTGHDMKAMIMPPNLLSVVIDRCGKEHINHGYPLSKLSFAATVCLNRTKSPAINMMYRGFSNINHFDSQFVKPANGRILNLLVQMHLPEVNILIDAFANPKFAEPKLVKATLHHMHMILLSRDDFTVNELANAARGLAHLPEQHNEISYQILQQIFSHILLRDLSQISDTTYLFKLMIGYTAFSPFEHNEGFNYVLNEIKNASRKWSSREFDVIGTGGGDFTGKTIVGISSVADFTLYISFNNKGVRDVTLFSLIYKFTAKFAHLANLSQSIRLLHGITKHHHCAVVEDREAFHICNYHNDVWKVLTPNILSEFDRIEMEDGLLILTILSLINSAPQFYTRVMKSSEFNEISKQITNRIQNIIIPNVEQHSYDMTSHKNNSNVSPQDIVVNEMIGPFNLINTFLGNETIKTNERIFKLFKINDLITAECLRYLHHSIQYSSINDYLYFKLSTSKVFLEESSPLAFTNFLCEVERRLSNSQDNEINVKILNTFINHFIYRCHFFRPNEFSRVLLILSNLYNHNLENTNIIFHEKLNEHIDNFHSILSVADLYRLWFSSMEVNRQQGVAKNKNTQDVKYNMKNTRGQDVVRNNMKNTHRQLLHLLESATPSEISRSLSREEIGNILKYGKDLLVFSRKIELALSLKK